MIVGKLYVETGDRNVPMSQYRRMVNWHFASNVRRFKLRGCLPSVLTQTLRFANRVYLCVPYVCSNTQPLIYCTAFSDWLFL